MNEPRNHSAWVDRFCDTWVRADDIPGHAGSWWPLTNGPGWDPSARSGVGTARTWLEVEEYGPFIEASSEQTVQALDRIRLEVAR